MPKAEKRATKAAEGYREAGATVGKAPGKRYPLSFKTTYETRMALERAASDSGRSLAQEVEHQIEKALSAEEALGGPDLVGVFQVMAGAAKTTQQNTGADHRSDFLTYLMMRQRLLDTVRDFLPRPPGFDDIDRLDRSKDALAQLDAGFRYHVETLLKAKPLTDTEDAAREIEMEFRQFLGENPLPTREALFGWLQRLRGAYPGDLVPYFQLYTLLGLVDGIRYKHLQKTGVLETK